MRPSFFLYFGESGINEATDLEVSQLLGSTITTISAHVPGQHMSGQGQGSSSPHYWRNPRKEIMKSSAIWIPCVSVNWRAQCHAKWPRHCREFQHSSRIEPKSPDSLQFTLTTKPLVHINCWKKTVHDSLYFATCNQFFANRTVKRWSFKLNINARHEILEFLSSNHWLICLIAFNINWSWNNFTLHNFAQSSMLIEQLINLKKVKTDNLKFGTDLWDRVMDGWSVTQ